METLYSLVGRLVVWNVILLIFFLFSWRLWEALPRSLRGGLLNRWLWVRMHVLGQRWPMPRSGAHQIIQAYQRHRCLARWERNLIAHAVRYNRRVGFQAEEQAHLPDLAPPAGPHR
jgi:hypothetical protein